MSAVEPTAACPVCGEPVEPGDAFCEACGADLPAAEAPASDPAPAGAACPSCGAVGEPVDGYCGSCGFRLPAPRDHTELELAGVAGVSDKGRRHARNEDAMAVSSAPGVVAAVVCDGVSSSVDPDVASEAAAGAALAALAEGHDLDAAFDAARAAVLAVDFERRGSLSPPSCTFLAATATDESITVASHGDCRAYWYAGGQATQLTVDDSMAEEQIAAGMPAEDAHTNAFAHVITRWLSVDADPDWRPRIVSFEVPGPGRLLLVSDGLWNYAVEADRLAEVLGEASSPRPPDELQPSPLDLARRLVAFANDAGGSDNITVVVVELPLPDPDPKGSPAP